MKSRLFCRAPAAVARTILLIIFVTNLAHAQAGHNAPAAPPPGAKAAKCANRPVPQLEDITAKAGITFKHTSDPSKKYIVESMSGGVILFDYDRDGWPDIYFTNAPTVEMAVKGQPSLGALYHNNHDGTFTDVTKTSGLTSPCFAMGGAVGDYDNDGWPDLYLTCLGGNVLYHNNGDGTFTDVTAKAGVADGRLAITMATDSSILWSRITLISISTICPPSENLPTASIAALMCSAGLADCVARAILSFTTTATAHSPTYRKAPA